MKGLLHGEKFDTNLLSSGQQIVLDEDKKKREDIVHKIQDSIK